MPQSRESLASESWTDWKTKPEAHGPFQYWQWNQTDIEESKKRLGERLYITACLLWTALHDRHVAEERKSDTPNWSAVAAYYSMVHALRLVWFLLYGSYPTGHSHMASVLSGRSGEKANWGREEGVPKGKAKITLKALQSAISDGLGDSDLSGRLLTVGSVFGTAIKLREDSNYESLILAHQYFHSSLSTDFINVQEQFERATAAMLAANQTVLQFVSDLLLTSFNEDHPWFCPATSFRPKDLLELTLGYVRMKIISCIRRRNEAPHSEGSWAGSVGRLGELLASSHLRRDEVGMCLQKYARFASFEMKRGILREFRDKVQRLEEVVQRPFKPEDTGEC